MRITLILLLLGLALLQVATVARAEKLGVAVPYPIYRLDPTKLDEPVSRIILENLCARLTYISNKDGQENIKLDFASSVEISKDSSVYRFTLANNAYFPSGRPVTGPELKASVEFFVTLLEDIPENQGANSHSSTDSKRTLRLESYLGELRSNLAQISSISSSAPSSSIAPKLSITLKSGNPTFLKTLALVPLADVRISEGFGRDFGLGTNSSYLGPYQIRSNSPDDGLVLEASPSYYRSGRPKTKILDFRYFSDADSALRALRVGAVDIIALPTTTQIESVAKDPTLITLKSPLRNLKPESSAWRLEQNYWSIKDNPEDSLNTQAIIVRKSLRLDQAAKDRFDLSGTYLP